MGVGGGCGSGGGALRVSVTLGVGLGCLNTRREFCVAWFPNAHRHCSVTLAVVERCSSGLQSRRRTRRRCSSRTSGTRRTR